MNTVSKLLIAGVIVTGVGAELYSQDAKPASGYNTETSSQTVKKIQRKKKSENKTQLDVAKSSGTLESRLINRQISYDDMSGRVSIYNKGNQTQVFVDESGKIYNAKGKEFASSGVSSVIKDNLKEIIEWGKQYKIKKAKESEDANNKSDKEKKPAEKRTNYMIGAGIENSYLILNASARVYKDFWLDVGLLGQKGYPTVENTVSKTGAKFTARGLSRESKRESITSAAIEYRKPMSEKLSADIGVALYNNSIKTDKYTKEEILLNGNVLSSAENNWSNTEKNSSLKARIGVHYTLNDNITLNANANIGGDLAIRAGACYTIRSKTKQ